MSVEHQQKLNKFFSQRGILYQPGFAIILKSINAAIFLDQLLYWHGKGRRADGYIYKTADEIYDETSLSRSMQEHAIKRLLEFGFISYKVAGIPATRCFKVEFLFIQKQLPSLKKKCNLNYLNPPTLYDDNLKPMYTETTPKTTAETTSETTRGPAHRRGGALSIGEIIQQRNQLDDIPF